MSPCSTADMDIATNTKSYRLVGKRVAMLWGLQMIRNIADRDCWITSGTTMSLHTLRDAVRSLSTEKAEKKNTNRFYLNTVTISLPTTSRYAENLLDIHIVSHSAQHTTKRFACSSRTLCSTTLALTVLQPASRARPCSRCTSCGKTMHRHRTEQRSKAEQITRRTN